MKSLTITVKVTLDEYDDGYTNFSQAEGIKSTLKKHLKAMAGDVQSSFFEQYDEITIRTEVK